jgi:uncharacterized membrane protein
MDVLANLLFWLHLIALAMAGGVSFGMPVVGRNMPTATAETRPLLFKIAHGLSNLGKVSFGVLLVTGPILLWLRFGGTAPSMGWFIAKMVLVVILFVGVIYSGILLKRAEGGDRSAGQMMPRLGQGLMVAFLGIILCAVFAFN